MRYLPQTLSCIFLLIVACGAAVSAREHPYLFFSAEELPVFRQNIKDVEWSRSAYVKMRAQVDAVDEVALPPPNAKIRSEWQPVIRRNLQTGAYAAFLYLIEGKEEDLDYARRSLITYANHFEDRINFHNLDDKDGIVIYDTGYLGIYSAWTYDMIYNELTPEERELIESKLLRAIVGMIHDTIEAVSMQDQWAGLTEDSGSRPKDYDWGPGQWNGTLFCNAGITAIAFVLEDEALIEQRIDNWKTYLARDMLADGMWQEEDFSYSRFCYSSLQLVAEMAHQYGYHEDLYAWEGDALPLSKWDPGYVDTAITAAEGHDTGLRSLKMFLDAQIDYQYPNLSPGNWGWTTNGADFLTRGPHATFYELGYLRHNEPVYGWVLNQLDRSGGNGFAQALMSPIMYGGSVVDDAVKPETASRWYNHAKWIVLKSIEGKEYWGSDAIYAFMPYAAERTKSLRPLSVDLFAFGKVIAPRVSKSSRLQAHNKDYYLTDDSWNAYLVEGQNPSLLKTHIAESWMRFHEFTPEFKISQACIDVNSRVRPSFWFDEVVERRSIDDRLDSRVLGMTGEYVLDILNIRYDEEQPYMRHFEWVWHAFGDLTLSNVADGEGGSTTGDWSATWLDSADGIGLRTTMIGSGHRKTGTKVSVRKDEFGSFVKAFRGNYSEWFVAVHEPFQGEPRIETVRRLHDDEGSVALKIACDGAFVDYVCVAFAADSAGFDVDGESMQVDGYYGYLRLENGELVGRGAIQSFRVRAEGIRQATINGKPVKLKQEGEFLSFQ